MTLLKNIAILSQVAKDNITSMRLAIGNVEDITSKSRIENALATSAEALTDMLITGVEVINGQANSVASPDLEILLDKIAAQNGEVVQVHEVSPPDEVHPGQVISVMSVDTLDQAAREAHDYDIPVDEE